MRDQKKVGRNILYQQAAAPSLGEIIRQTRRQHNITQTELGGTRFSKSYVSAVERNKIPSSQAALRFFAEQLGQPDDYFTSMCTQISSESQVSVINDPDLLSTQHTVQQEGALTLLDMLLESTELHNFPAHHEVPILSAEVIAALPRQSQARYYFLMGLMAKEKQDFAASLQAFEYALTLSPPSQRAAILNELGLYYYQMQAYQTALGYHLRALQALQEENANDTKTDTLFKIELYCGDDYYALREYQRAYEHYELARSQLRSDYAMHLVGLLYRSLGYCMFAMTYQRTALFSSIDQQTASEEIEQGFQRALDFLLQSRILYQMSSNSIEETRSRLAQAMVLLNFSAWRRHTALLRAKEPISITNCTSLLNEAEEQCRQILMRWQHLSNDAMSVPVSLDTDLFIALAYLIRVYVQRASVSRLNNYRESAMYERMVAANLCQQVLDTLIKHELPLLVVRAALNIQTGHRPLESASLPNLPAPSPELESLPHSLMSQVEVYFASGELAEDFASATTGKEYAQYCYTHADQCFQRGLVLAQSIRTSKQPELHYTLRCYQYYTHLLQERKLTTPDFASETAITLLDTLEEAWRYSQSPVLPLNIEAS